jgi:hypothetical protein
MLVKEPQQFGQVQKDPLNTIATTSTNSAIPTTLNKLKTTHKVNLEQEQVQIGMVTIYTTKPPSLKPTKHHYSRGTSRTVPLSK